MVYPLAEALLAFRWHSKVQTNRLSEPLKPKKLNVLSRAFNGRRCWISAALWFPHGPDLPITRSAEIVENLTADKR